MRVVYPAEMAALDRAAIEAGTPSLELMERAGRHVAEQARDMLGLCAGKRIAVVAGRGNNGGDGLVAARYLSGWGAETLVVLLGEASELSRDAAANHERLLEAGGEVVGAEEGLKRLEGEGHDLVIDAVFGTGFRGAAEGVHARAIEAVNASGAPVLAVDVPSGMDAATGGVEGPAVRAARTVTFAWPKVGQYLFPGAELVGELVVVDIGIPGSLLGEVVESDIETVEEAEVAALLPRRRLDAHKGECGRVLVVAGSEGLTGAAALCARSAMRAGAGVVTLGIPRSLNAIMEVKLTEVMTLPLPDERGHLAEEALDTVLEALEGYDALALGPGLGTALSTARVVEGLLRRARRPLVLDADGINCAAAFPGALRDRAWPTLITPHPGELGRLLGSGAREVQRSRLECAARAAGDFGCAVALKGAYTIVASPRGRLHINPVALPALATAGSGDVLTGCAAAFLAQGLDPVQAGICGVYVHARAAGIAAQLTGAVGMLAGDIVAHLPLALTALMKEGERGAKR
ncbi:MAG: NAD(P)H-hydrate dehydratase [Actinomycetota bacterium]|nr:NAD(P)H-hydrate dehydratase [Actinomycetota bacterium]